MDAIEIPDSIRCELEEKGGIAGIAESLPDDRKIEDIVSVARALSDPVRVRVLFTLAVQPVCVCLLVAMTGYAYSKMSYHLSVLKEGGLVCARQEGNYLIYHPTDLGRRVTLWIGLREFQQHTA